MENKFLFHGAWQSGFFRCPCVILQSSFLLTGAKTMLLGEGWFALVWRIRDESKIFESSRKRPSIHQEVTIDDLYVICTH